MWWGGKLLCPDVHILHCHMIVEKLAAVEHFCFHYIMEHDIYISVLFYCISSGSKGLHTTYSRTFIVAGTSTACVFSLHVQSSICG